MLADYLRKMTTGADNHTPDIARISGAIAVPLYLGMGLFDVIKNHHIDYLSFGSGFGALIAGVGVCIGFKAGTEPPKDHIP